MADMRMAGVSWLDVGAVLATALENARVPKDQYVTATVALHEAFMFSGVVVAPRGLARKELPVGRGSGWGKRKES